MRDPICDERDKREGQERLVHATRCRPCLSPTSVPTAAGLKRACVGIGPVRRFAERARNCNLVTSCISGGMEPESELAARWMETRERAENTEEGRAHLAHKCETRQILLGRRKRKQGANQGAHSEEVSFP